MGGAISGRVGPYNQGDITIAVAGLRGSGKSTFINTAAGSDILEVGHALSPRPHEILPVECVDPGNKERKIFFVEVPAFDCELPGDYEKKLKQWLKRLPPKNLNMSGILFLHRITDAKISATTSLLKALCENAIRGPSKRVALVTTRWGSLRSPAIGAQREKECQQHWDELAKDFVTLRPLRFDDSFESAWSTVSDLLGNPELYIPVTISGEKISVDPPRYKPIPVMKSGSTGSYDEKLSTRVHLPNVLGDHHRSQTLPNEAPSVYNHYTRLPESQEPYTSAQILISEITKDTRHSEMVARLRGEEAQCVVDFMNVTLHEDNALKTPEGRSILALLSKLARTAQKFPRCYELQGVEFDISKSEGGGGFADIFKGTYQNKTICLKIVRLYTQEDKATLLKAHVRELILWAHLRHPNILPFYGVYLVNNERICIASPWMDHGDLFHYLRKSPEIPRHPLVSDILAGLLYLHQSNIVHGDLKAQNILVSDQGTALVADFGISTVIATTGIAPSNTIITGGTTRWVAPEIVSGDVALPTRYSDIWSLSCLLFEIYTRKVPFHQYNDYKVIAVLQGGKEIPTKPPPPLEDPHDIVDDLVWDLMTQCWNYEPKNRPSCEDVRESFNKLQFPDHRPPVPTPTENSSALSKAMKAMKAASGAQIDHERALEILRRIRRDNGIAPYV